MNDEAQAAAAEAEAQQAEAAAAEAEAQNNGSPIEEQQAPAAEQQPEAEAPSSAYVADEEDVNAEARGESDGSTDSFTVTTTNGEEKQIVGKKYAGQVPVLVSDEGAFFVATLSGGGEVEPYNPAVHGGDKDTMSDEPTGEPEEEIES